MVTEQANITETIILITTEEARVAAETMAMASAENYQRAQNTGPKLGSPLMRQPTFDWSSAEMHAELRNFKIEVIYMFQTII